MNRHDYQDPLVPRDPVCALVLADCKVCMDLVLNGSDFMVLLARVLLNGLFSDQQSVWMGRGVWFKGKSHCFTVIIYIKL